MYIVAIAWIYVVLMMSITEQSIIAGILTFVFYGLVPLALFLWIFGTPARRRAAHRNALLAQAEASVGESVDQVVDQHDAADAGRNEHHLLNGGGQLGTTVQTGDQVGDGDIDHAGSRDAQQVGHRP
ncbi:hypothetical protein BSY238_64 [Methyloversatilis sp. RAC08]|nr:hypothetical protein BSY238_64 [Methyloversatilis sp. RAC08]